MEWNYTDEAPADRDFLVQTKGGFRSIAYKIAGKTILLSVHPAAEVVAWADVPKTERDLDG